ncbi:MAG: calcium-binding protein [Leptolyngbyaceae cyanobacterium SM1_3_5]|nr:calcium-binding protein [Leptolyngbyaceae cyanobacterium SM1_3_5]
MRSAVSFSLVANVENLVLTGNAAIDGFGNELNNTLTGNNANNVLIGFAGNDTIDGRGGTDTLVGGLGDDRYLIGDASDQIVEEAGEGTDTAVASVSYTLSANVENLTLTGNSVLNGTGNAIDNLLIGNNTNNDLFGLDGNDTLDGRGGNDALIGGEGDDRLLGGDGDDYMEGNAGNDSIEGGSGNDFLSGRDGNDLLDGGTGDDTMFGDAGDDIYVVDSLGDRVTERENDGTDLVRASISYQLGDFLENLALTGSGNLNAVGNDLANVLTGNSGRNSIAGGAGNDTLIGNNGNDILTGDSGDDLLIGGLGSDTLTGGSGRDRFVYAAFQDRTDTITDFNSAQDLLNLEAVFDYLGSTPVTNAFLRFSQSGSNALVQIDQNGATGGANFSTLVTLNNVTANSLAIGTNVLV